MRGPPAVVWQLLPKIAFVQFLALDVDSHGSIIILAAALRERSMVRVHCRDAFIKQHRDFPRATHMWTRKSSHLRASTPVAKASRTTSTTGWRRPTYNLPAKAPRVQASSVKRRCRNGSCDDAAHPAQNCMNAGGRKRSRRVESMTSHAIALRAILNYPAWQSK